MVIDHFTKEEAITFPVDVFAQVTIIIFQASCPSDPERVSNHAHRSRNRQQGDGDQVQDELRR
ncbi:MAG TPA: hypothetical protein PKX44_08935, partial [Methanomassiliicoccaceae archaeon]|nr:hypothetical protein [Methanomassiliicoccaceae archaeon]